MKISIIVPVYNVHKYIERCLDSVIAQETRNYELECILVNDFTPDDSMSIINCKLQSYSGNVIFKIINHDRNRGLSAARNSGIESAEGSYLLFLDSDDWLVSGSIDLMAGFIQQYPDVDFVEGRYLSKKYGVVYPDIPKLMYYSVKGQILEGFYMNKLVHSAWNKLLRKDFVENNSLFFVEGLLFEDLEWSNRLFHSVSSFIVIPTTTYIYEDNPSSIMNSVRINGSEVIRSFIRIINSLLDAPYNDLYVEHKLFIFRSLLNALDIVKNSVIDKIAERELLSLRGRFFYSTIKNGRFFLMLFFMLMYEPFYSLLRFSFFRHKISAIEKVILFFAKKMECFHRQ